MERSKGVSQRELAKLLEVSRWTIQQVEGVGWQMQPLVGSMTQLRS